MEAILALGVWPFVGLCAGTGAIAFLVTRAITPAKMCQGIESTYGEWARQEGRYKQFSPGARRLVHVSRGAIGVNMRSSAKLFPTGVVIDEHGHKWEFHEVYLHGGGTLLFDRDGDSANVYLVTTGQISGRWLKDQPTQFTDADKIPMPESPVKSLEAKIAQLEEELRAAKSLLVNRESRIESLINSHSVAEATAEKGYEQAHSIIEDLRGQLERLQTEYNEEVKSKRILPLHSRINFEEQTRTERMSRSIKVGYGCGSHYDTEYYDEQVALQPGEEGFIDLEQGVKFVRVRKRSVNEEVVPVPLEEGEVEYGKPIPC